MSAGRHVPPAIKARIVQLSRESEVSAEGLAARFGLSRTHVLYLIRTARVVDSAVACDPSQPVRFTKIVNTSHATRS